MAQEKWLVEGQKTIDIESARRLKVGLIGGQLDIVAHDEPGIRIEIHEVTGKPLKVVLDGDTLEIDHPQVSWDNWLEVFRNFGQKARADVSVMVPRGIDVKVGVVSATALVSGVSGDANVSTVSGDLVIDGSRGDLQLNAVSGELTVRGHEGRLTAHSVSGDVTASGAISTASADTVSGAVFLDLHGTADEVRVNTVSGSVATRLEAGTAASYSVSTVGGKLQLDSSEISGIRGRYTGKYGELDQSWTDLRINTVGGDISILHAAPTASADASSEGEAHA